MRVALYIRVSTDDQTTENQSLALHEVALRRGWSVVKVYEDAGISGAKGRDKRPALDALLKDATRREFDLIAAWSVDRLGRSLQHLITILGDIQGLGVDLYLHQQAVDTSTPSGRALYQMLGVFAEFEREMIRARVVAGLRNAKAKGQRLGRKPASVETTDNIQKLRAEGYGILRIAKTLGCGVSVVQRVLGRVTA